MAALSLDRIFFGVVYALQGLLLWPFRRKPLVYSFGSEVNISGLVDQYRHEVMARGGRCYLIGRGPSLDKFTSGDLPDGLNLCVNAAYTAVRRPDLVFFHDDNMLTSVSDVLNSGAKLVLPININLTSGRTALVEEFVGKDSSRDCFFYHCRQFAPFQVYESDDNSLLTMSGTVHSAISFAKKIGAKQICFVGIDGGSFQGKVFSNKFDQRKCKLRQRLIYRKIRFDCVVLCRFLGIDYRFL